MDQFIENGLLLFGAVFASSGFWLYLSNRTGKKSNTNKLLLGIAHTKILQIGLFYIQRGWLTYDEYEDYMHYLWEPYESFGGNGLAAKIVEEVRKLPVQRNGPLYNDKGDMTNVQEQNVRRP